MTKPIMHTEKEIKERIGNELKAWRMQAGLSTYRVERLSPYGSSFVSRVENGKATAPIQMIETLAELYEQDPTELLRLAVRLKVGDRAAAIEVEEPVQEQDLKGRIHALINVDNASPADTKRRIEKAMGFLQEALREIDGTR